MRKQSFYAAKKSTVPSLVAWHLYSFVTYGLTPIYNTETVYVRPTKNSEPLYNITAKGKRITSEPSLMLSYEVIQKENKVTFSWNKYLDCDNYIIEYGTMIFRIQAVDSKGEAVSQKAGTDGNGKSATNTQRITSTTFTFSVPIANADYVFKFRALDKNSNILFGWTDWTKSYHVD